MTPYNKKWLLRCKKCGHEFYPWQGFMITKTVGKERKEFLFCPECNNFKESNEFKID
jgi:hypothetical protein